VAPMAADVADFYDRFGDREFGRPSLVNYVSEALHEAFLRGARGRALDAGAGIGRFTVPLARHCRSVVVVDISSSQLERNRVRVREAGLLRRIEAHLQLDISHLKGLGDSSFDSVVCFRGPINYSVTSLDRALSELLRVTRPGGLLLVSVRTRFSAIRSLALAGVHLNDLLQMRRALGVSIKPVIRARHVPAQRLISIGEFLDLVAHQSGVVERVSGDGFLTPWLAASTQTTLWPAILKIERRLARDVYAVATANHAMFAIRKSATNECQRGSPPSKGAIKERPELGAAIGAANTVSQVGDERQASDWSTDPSRSATTGFQGQAALAGRKGRPSARRTVI